MLKLRVEGLTIGVGLCCIVWFFIAVQIWTTSHRVPISETFAPRAAERVETVDDGSFVQIAAAPVTGNSQARTFVVEFSDFECPFCGRFAREVYPDVKRLYIDPGLVRYAFKNLPLPIHKGAVQAAIAGECAHEQGHFWELHDHLFSHKSVLGTSDLAEYIRTLNLDAEAYASCEKDWAPHQVASDIWEAEALGLDATPTFLIGRLDTDGRVTIARRIRGFLPIDAFSGAVQEVLRMPSAAVHD